MSKENSWKLFSRFDTVLRTGKSAILEGNQNPLSVGAGKVIWTKETGEFRKGGWKRHKLAESSDETHFLRVDAVVIQFDECETLTHQPPEWFCLDHVADYCFQVYHFASFEMLFSVLGEHIGYGLINHKQLTGSKAHHAEQNHSIH
jgi:hypothetical protein